MQYQSRHVVPIGSQVRIVKQELGPFPLSREATVIGYDVRGPVVTCTTPLRLEYPQGTTFRWPKVFPWQVDVIQRGWFTPRQWGRTFRHWLVQPAQSELIELYGCGWMDGGCRILARGIQIWLGKTVELCGIQDGATDGVQHVVAQHGQWYLDGDGAASLKQLRQRWQRVERLVNPIIAPAPETLHILNNDVISARLAQNLDQRFNRRAVSALLGR